MELADRRGYAGFAFTDVLKRHTYSETNSGQTPATTKGDKHDFAF